MLFAAGEPVRRARLIAAFSNWLGATDSSSVDQAAGSSAADDAASAGEATVAQRVDAALEALRARHAGHGVELVETAGGFWFRTPARCADAVRALLPERPARPSRALLETLAVIAYRQPVTRGEIEDVRGVAVGASIVRSLLDREWIRVIGHLETPGRPALFATTQRFLDDLGLKRLDELPPLEELRARGRDAVDRAELSDAALRRKATSEAAAVEIGSGAGDEAWGGD
ncbi:MAG: SMC-Scp complex subunit ScpB [Thioalkalivibrionaceae bacterium]